MKKNIFIILTTTLLNFSPTQGSLSELALKYDTDKGPQGHNYTQVYEHYFNGLKDKPVKLLEIGYWQGRSAKMFNDYFVHPDSRFYFIDGCNSCLNFITDLPSRCQLYKADQSREADLLKFIQDCGKEFDIIIDDGSHFVQHQILSFKTLFPYVKSGGVYIIEDLFTSYIEWGNPGCGGAGTKQNPQASAHSAIRFLQTLVDDVNFHAARSGYADRKKCPEEIAQTFNIYQRDIASIHFYASLCFVFKN